MPTPQPQRKQLCQDQLGSNPDLAVWPTVRFFNVSEPWFLSSAH